MCAITSPSTSARPTTSMKSSRRMLTTWVQKKTTCRGDAHSMETDKWKVDMPSEALETSRVQPRVMTTSTSNPYGGCLTRIVWLPRPANPSGMCALPVPCSVSSPTSSPSFCSSPQVEPVVLSHSCRCTARYLECTVLSLFRVFLSLVAHLCLPTLFLASQYSYYSISSFDIQRHCSLHLVHLVWG